MSAAFTPGPWRIGIWCGDKDRKHVVDMGVPDGVTTFAMLSARNSTFPASAVVHSDGDRCEVEANAHLIAAAPELYEEAAFLCARLRDLECSILGDDVGNEYYGHVAPSRARLESALAKVRGEQMPA